MPDRKGDFPRWPTAIIDAKVIDNCIQTLVEVEAHASKGTFRLPFDVMF